MLVLGLTGKAGTGKNVVAGEMEKRGWPTLDVDKLGHPILETCHDELAREFGREVIRPDGTVDRKRIGSIVFADPKKLKALEAITHPRMVETCRQFVAGEREKGTAVVVLNAALLHRMGLDALCDRVLFVETPYEVRFLRCRERDHMDGKRFQDREDSQKDITKDAVREGIPVDVLENDGSIDSLHRQVAAYCDKLRSQGLCNERI